jgi:hypothetical protein
MAPKSKSFVINEKYLKRPQYLNIGFNGVEGRIVVFIQNILILGFNFLMEFSYNLATKLWSNMKWTHP